MLNNKIECDNIPNLIRNDNYYKYISYVKNYEDSIMKIFKSNNYSNIKENNNILLHKINKDENNDLFDKMREFDINEFSFMRIKNLSKIVIIGPYVRNCLINQNFISNNIKNREEIYLFKYNDEKWEDIVENINDFVEKPKEYVLEKNNKKIIIIKKRYISLAHILLQHDYVKRVGWEMGTYYVSSMFLIEYQKHKKAINELLCDPILKYPYDPLGIYCINEKYIKNPVKIIETVNLDELMNLNEKNITKLYFSKTLIEICMDKYMKENNIVVLEEIENMLIYLSNFIYKRSPYFYARIIKLYEKNTEIYDLICNNEKYNIYDNIDIENHNTLDGINNCIIDYFIKNDDNKNFINYLTNMQLKINSIIINNIIKYNSKNIMENLINNNIIDEYTIYKIILLSGNVEFFKMVKFNMDIAINFLGEIISNGIYESFMYLIDIDESIMGTTFDKNKNIFHILEIKNQFESIFEKMIEKKNNLLLEKDDNNDIPLFFCAKNNPKMLEYYLKYNIDFSIINNEGNTCLHYLATHNEPEILKKILNKFPELIDMPNMKSEYPIIISCQNKQEEMFYIFKSFGANLDAKDIYGNTVYHYICANAMCLNMEIKNVPNFFGIYPKEYCNIAEKFYIFI